MSHMDIEYLPLNIPMLIYKIHHLLLLGPRLKPAQPDISIREYLSYLISVFVNSSLTEY